MTPARPLSVLVIEDDADVRQTLADLLEINGYRPLVAADGAEGLAAARREAPAVIITDLAMPVMDGFQLLDALHADPALRTIPVIVITAKVDRAATRRGMELGADDFITKPFTEEEVLHSLRARLEKKDLLDELDAFAHTVAHDLKNPLATLRGRLELAGLMLGKADEAAIRQHLTAATTAAFRLSAIIDELLVLSGVRRQTVVPQSLDMGAIVTEASDRLEHLLQTHGARIEKPATWPPAVGHAPWIGEVWANYLSNAAKYSGPHPLITLGAELRPGGRTARFWVQDRGPGLDAAAQARLFVPFSRISSVRTNGHGLGLSIVRRILDKLGGSAGVESAPGAGARFWFELPSAPASAHPFVNPPKP
jgi:two-component system sensor histidine kinase/response regulator